MSDRRTSLGGQLSRTARRFSAVIVPQLTKLEAVGALDHITHVETRIVNILQMQNAMEKYVLRNAVIFEPIDFDIINPSGHKILRAVLHPEEFVILEGSKKILSVYLASELDDNVLARVRHPVSGLKMYEFVDIGGTILIQSSGDEFEGCSLHSESAFCSSILLGGGCLFTKNQWTISKKDEVLVTVRPVRSFFQENTFRTIWEPSADNDVRMLSIVWTLLITIRDAFPSLHTLTREYRSRQL